MKDTSAVRIALSAPGAHLEILIVGDKGAIYNLCVILRIML
jgi:hypothetical protein